MKINGPTSYPEGGFIFEAPCKVFAVEVGRVEGFWVCIAGINKNRVRIRVYTPEGEEIKSGTDLSDITFDIDWVCIGGE